MRGSGRHGSRLPARTPTSGALDAWLELVGGDPAALDPGGPAIPDGLAIKLYPCCYALQRPIRALSTLAAQGLDPARVQRIVLRTPEATVVPLIHHRPVSGLQGKFSLEYAAAAALLDDYPGFGSFTDSAVRRDAAQRLVGLVEVEPEPGDWHAPPRTVAAKGKRRDQVIYYTGSTTAPAAPQERA
jgi:2-methylcitrate dehydratase PrpD